MQGIIIKSFTLNNNCNNVLTAAKSRNPLIVSFIFLFERILFHETLVFFLFLFFCESES